MLWSATLLVVHHCLVWWSLWLGSLWCSVSNQRRLNQWRLQSVTVHQASMTTAVSSAASKSQGILQIMWIVVLRRK